ncbi:ATP synthase F1 subunit gamma [Eremococcus coleocola]|uniref:ATP synthase F1 subunit gamma n=1 Tax=Eremococcus coleocola TaxID=88132 RepID=UPI0003F60B44|nr:ATP synthase F1 subunit gamma [Eremococcus coleocola]
MALNEIKKKMNSIQKTSQITNAMRLVSTTKYNSIVIESAKYDAYSQKIKEMVSSVIRPDIQYDLDASPVVDEDGNNDSLINFHSMMEVRPVNKVGFLVITSDKGLAGNYNTSILKEFRDQARKYRKDQIEVLAIGAPIAKFCRENGYHLAYERYHLSDYPSFTEVRNIIREAVNLFKDKTYDELYLCYNHSINVLVNEYRFERILPISPENIRHLHEENKDKVDPQVLIEPDVNQVLDFLLPLYAQTQIYGAVIDAKTAEQSARMQAMGQATDNAEKLIADLQQEYHHERQKRITNEIIEITNGANAQVKEKKG